MKMRKRVFAFVAALMCMLPLVAGGLGFGEQASAAAKDIKVTLHKKKMDDFPGEYIKNTGGIMQDIEEQYKPLDGVSFKVWDITKQFHDAVNAEVKGDETPEEYQGILTELMKDFKVKTNDPSAIEGQTVVTKDGGLAEFTLKDRGDDGIYKVYYFEELIDDQNQKQVQPLILALPVMKQGTSEPNEDIHLYPKNKISDGDLEKEVVDDEGVKIPEKANGVYDYEVGAQVHYKVTYTIPSQIGEIINVDSGTDKQTRYTSLLIKDAVDQVGLKFEGISPKVKVDGTEEDFDKVFPSQYVKKEEFSNPEDKTTKAGFQIDFKLNSGKEKANPDNFNESKATAEHFHKYAGRKIDIFYTVSFTKDTPIDQDIKNNFTVSVGQNGDTPKTEGVPDDKKPDPVITGGKKFFKVEEGKTGQGLAGAKFIILKEDKDTKVKSYLKVIDGKNVWEVVDSAEKYPGAKEIESNASGKCEITGLEYGTYILHETKAPNGFMKGDDKTFVVEKGSYANSAPEQEVPNVSKGGFLPSTGGMGIVAFLAIGLGLMGAAYIRFRRVQQDA